MRENWIRATEAAALTIFSVLLAGLEWNLGAKMAAGTASLWILVPGVILGWLAGDLASGLVHWFCDNFFEEDSRLIGPLLIQPFREHHRNPLGMAGHGFLELTGNSCLAMIPVVSAVIWWSDRIPALLEASALFFFLALFATNLFHRWAHASVVPCSVRWLQAHWLILPPARHQMHHQNGYTGAYCITTGWLNRPLDLLLRAR